MNISKKEIYTILEDIIADKELEFTKVEDDMSIFGDLEFDSLDVFELIAKIENVSGETFNGYDKLSSSMESVKCLCDYVQEI